MSKRFSVSVMEKVDVIYSPKLTTSKTFAVMSSETVANSWPSALAETATMGVRWAR